MPSRILGDIFWNLPISFEFFVLEPGFDKLDLTQLVLDFFLDFLLFFCLDSGRILSFVQFSRGPI